MEGVTLAGRRGTLMGIKITYTVLRSTRYKVVAHCVGFSVVDSGATETVGSTVCECFNRDDAEMMCDALNRRDAEEFHRANVRRKENT